MLLICVTGAVLKLTVDAKSTISCRGGISNIFSGHLNFSLPGTPISFSPSSFGHH